MSVGECLWNEILTGRTDSSKLSCYQRCCHSHPDSRGPDHNIRPRDHHRNRSLARPHCRCAGHHWGQTPPPGWCWNISLTRVHFISVFLLTKSRPGRQCSIGQSSHTPSQCHHCQGRSLRISVARAARRPDQCNQHSDNWNTFCSQLNKTF